MDVLPSTFIQIILAAKSLVRHSSKSPQPAGTTFAFPSVRILFDGWLYAGRALGEVRGDQLLPGLRLQHANTQIKNHPGQLIRSVKM